MTKENPESERRDQRPESPSKRTGHFDEKVRDEATGETKVVRRKYRVLP